MCMSSPSMPAPPPPPPEPQAAKGPDQQDAKTVNALRKQNTANSPLAGGTLLTGPSGIANSALKTAGGSLLGG